MTPKVIADFESQLTTAISVGGTSFTLSSVLDDDGITIPNGLYYFTVDNGTSVKEYLKGTLTGSSVASVFSVSRQGAETSGAVRRHRIGASIIITDFATYVKYMDSIALVSAPDASTSAKGVVEAATQAEIDADTALGGTGAVIAVAPDKLATSKYGTRLPSAAEKVTLSAIQAGTYFANPTIQVFTASGTWTKPAGLKYIIVEGVGGGGGGGSSGNTNGNTGGGGGGGGYSLKRVLAASLGATETVTCGAGGAGGASGNGGAGVTTTFGAHISVTGGGGGVQTGRGGGGGQGSSGDFNLKGSPGSSGVSTGNIASTGGSSFFGGGAEPTAGSTAGIAGVNGGGGSGGSCSSGSTDRTGGTGGVGSIIVTEYY